jgi:hypothetical protein
LVAAKCIFDAVREAAVDWDGRDPIRRDWPARLNYRGKTLASIA